MQNYVCLDWLLPHSRLTSKTRPLQKIGIKSSTLEDKCTACEMLVLYVETLKEGFGPYLNEVAEIMIPLLEFYYHDGTKSQRVALPIMCYSFNHVIRCSSSCSAVHASLARSRHFFEVPLRLYSQPLGLNFKRVY
jgi:hypothetical protein